jgi:hypothetical protein
VCGPGLPVACDKEAVYVALRRNTRTGARGLSPLLAPRWRVGGLGGRGGGGGGARVIKGDIPVT